MRVVFIEDVEGVAFGGEVKEVKNGFARNYLIPKNLAAQANHNNRQRINKLKKNAAVTRAHRLDEMKNLAGNLDGSEITIEMRAGANNRLYGSVTGTMVADALAEETGIPIERRLVQLDDPIREVGTYEVPLRLYAEINASIKVIVYATGTDPFEMVAEEEDSSEDNPDQGSVEEEDTASIAVSDESSDAEEEELTEEDSEEPPQE
ncbi:MAG: 50S ribosomal protein L9 [Chloroflexota bacterium]|nr:50S ribosomal protein L9 [Chloroflexota bacterium]